MSTIHLYDIKVKGGVYIFLINIYVIDNIAFSFLEWLYNEMYTF